MTHARGAPGPALFVLLACFAGGAASAADPGAEALPATERFVYARTVGEVKDRVEIDFRRKSDKGTTWFELSSRAPDEDSLFILDATTLAVLKSDVTTRSPSATIRKTSELIEDRAVPKADEIQIAATAPFLQRLRLIPFAGKPVYRISFQGAASFNGFTLQVSVAGRETITVEGRAWDCWRLDFGAAGAMGAFIGMMGKTRYWYAVDWPHVLVRTEGPAGFPGSPWTKLDLVSYSSRP